MNWITVGLCVLLLLYLSITCSTTPINIYNSRLFNLRSISIFRSPNIIPQIKLTFCIAEIFFILLINYHIYVLLHHNNQE